MHDQVAVEGFWGPGTVRAFAETREGPHVLVEIGALQGPIWVHRSKVKPYRRTLGLLARALARVRAAVR